jgi:uncharacterized YccA/Bax inhibitor family protein
MSNPVFSRNQWGAISAAEGRRAAATMTVRGVVLKTSILLVVVMGVLGLTWDQIQKSGSFFGIAPMHALIGSGIGSLVLVLIMRFMPRAAAVLGILYAALEGVFLGVLTLFIEARFSGQGLPLLAAGLTATTLFGMLMLYMTGIIRATPLFVKIVGGAILGLVLGVVGLMVLAWIFPWAQELRSTLYGSGPIGIGFSLFVVGLAAFTLVLDFDFIERGAKGGLPKYMEWVGAFGLLVTLVWLYVEILILLSKLRGGD